MQGSLQGSCEPTGYCSLPDPSCPSGQRYVPEAGAGLGGRCVSAESDGGTPTDGSAGAITFVGSASQATGNDNQVGLAQPAGLTAGDLLLAVVATDDTAAVVTAPAGWTLRSHQPVDPDSSWYWRLAGAAEPARYVFAIDRTPTVAGALVAYRGVNPALMQGGFDADSVATTLSAPSLTTRHTNTMLVTLFTAGGLFDFTWSPPAGMTKRVDVSHAMIFDAPKGPAGMTDLYTPDCGCALPPSGAVWVVALAPPGG